MPKLKIERRDFDDLVHDLSLVPKLNSHIKLVHIGVIWEDYIPEKVQENNVSFCFLNIKLSIRRFEKKILINNFSVQINRF